MTDWVRGYWQRSSQSQSALWFGLFVICLLLNAVGGRWWQSTEGLDIYVESTAIANALVEGRGYADPFYGVWSGPSAHMAPAYPTIYAAIIFLFGVGHASWLIVRFLTIAAYTYQLSMLPRICRAARVREDAGLFAALLGAVIPLPGTLYKWEAVFVGALFTFILLVVLEWINDGRARPVTLGIATGVIFLFTPVPLPILAAWILTLLVVRRLWRPRELLILVAIPALILTPWTIRNYARFGGFFFIRDCLGIVMAVSNNDCAVPLVREATASGCFDQHYPTIANPSSGDEIRKLNEYRWNLEQAKIAREWIRTHQARFRELTLARIRYFWFPIDRVSGSVGLVLGILVTILTLLTPVGLYIMWKQSRVLTLLLVECLLLFQLPYALGMAEVRYRYPVLWVSLLACGMIVASMMELGRRRRMGQVAGTAHVS